MVGQVGGDYGPVTVTGSGATYTITLAKPITAADRVTVSIGNASVSSFSGELAVLPGDVNDDGVVNGKDLLAKVRDMISGVLPPTIFGDINGDGVVDSTDYLDVLQRMGTKLPRG